MCVIFPFISQTFSCLLNVWPFPPFSFSRGVTFHNMGNAKTEEKGKTSLYFMATSVVQFPPTPNKWPAKCCWEALTAIFLLVFLCLLVFLTSKLQPLSLSLLTIWTPLSVAHASSPCFGNTLLTPGVNNFKASNLLKMVMTSGQIDKIPFTSSPGGKLPFFKSFPLTLLCYLKLPLWVKYKWLRGRDRDLPVIQTLCSNTVTLNGVPQCVTFVTLLKPLSPQSLLAMFLVP